MQFLESTRFHKRYTWQCFTASLQYQREAQIGFWTTKSDELFETSTSDVNEASKVQGSAKAEARYHKAEVEVEAKANKLARPRPEMPY